MYEEEDDDLPTQYQRLNAHLQTSSWIFNRKLHDYIATQQGVRNMFLHQQFPGQSFQPYGAQFAPNGQVPMVNQTMLPPQTFNPPAQTFAQPSQPFSPQGYQQNQQGYRHAPYNIPQRPQSHQRSASIPTPQSVQNFTPSIPQGNLDPTTAQGDVSRRMSLPPHALEQGNESQSRPSLSRSSTAQSLQQQPVSTHGVPSGSSAPTSAQGTPRVRSGNTTPVSHQFASLPFSTSSQVIDMNPLSLSLPPESQQLIGSALDPNDPRTAIFMAGSDNIPQPFMGTYSYNPNLSPKSRMGASVAGMTQTLAPENSIKLDTAMDGTSSDSPPSAMSESIFSPHSLFTPSGFEYSNFFDQYQVADGNQTTSDHTPFEDDSFVNWSQ